LPSSNLQFQFQFQLVTTEPKLGLILDPVPELELGLKLESSFGTVMGIRLLETIFFSKIKFGTGGLLKVNWQLTDGSILVYLKSNWNWV
jgi:hypothetical protein